MGTMFGYEVRTPSKSELTWFDKNKDTSGMAAEDGKIILNPYSGLSQEQQSAVMQNEASRLWMRENNFDPKFKMTQQQLESFKGSAYELDSTSAKQSIIGRIISNDPSAGDVTPEQKAYTDWVFQRLQQRGK